MIKIQLKELAEQRKLNISQVQRGVGLDMGLVRRYWHNETTSVDLRAIEKMCGFLNCQPGDLIVRVDGQS